MVIYGAGLAGLLAARMLARHKPAVYEAQASLPNNHDALLRFRSDAVSKATGIPFKKVRVQKAICFKGQLINNPDLRLNNMYAKKVTGSILSRSILSLDAVDRYIAPPDFIRQLADGIDIRYGKSLSGVTGNAEEAAISTIPMPGMMAMCKWKDVPEFEYRSIYTYTAILDNTDVYQTLYYPGDEDYYRVSITGNKLIVEVALQDEDGPDEDNAQSVCLRAIQDFGISGSHVGDCKTHFQKFGKLIPIDDDARKEFILALSDVYNIYSVGRFATWRQILMDDVVNDVQFVERLMSQRSHYDRLISR